MKVLIFSAFEPLPSDGIAPLRYAQIAEEFLLHGHEVIFVAPTFFHLLKKQRNEAKWTKTGNPENLILKLIKTPSYKSHSGLKRLYSHYILARNLKKLLCEIDGSELIISAYPPITANYYLAKWAKKNNIPYIIDIQDVWPLNFEQLLPGATKFLVGFLKNRFSFITKNAFAVVPVSVDFIPHISTKKNALVKVFHLGTDTSIFPGISESISNEKFRILYVGNASTNNLLHVAIKAVSKIKNAELHIIGLRQSSKNLEEFYEQNNIKNVFFIPWLSQEDLAKEAVKFDAALLLVNPNSYIAFPYKAFTYFAAGLPVINNIRGGEVEKMLAENNFGITLKLDNEAFIEDAIYEIMQKRDFYNRQKIREFAINNFQKQIIYRQYYIWVMQVFSANA